MNKKNFLSSLLLSSILIISCGENNQNSTVQSESDKVSIEASVNSKISSYKNNLEWEAYKTERKEGVKGTFTKINLYDTQENLKFPESLVGSKFSIDGLSVSSGDVARDANLNSFFFKRLASPEITGTFEKFENGKATIKISLNGKEAVKEFNYTLNDNEITIKGSIDILNDFDAQKSFKALHGACSDLHEGKTWTDVNLTIKISK